MQNKFAAWIVESFTTEKIVFNNTTEAVVGVVAAVFMWMFINKRSK